MKKKPPVSKNFEIKVMDCGGYFQVYFSDAHAEVKLGNIYPPGYESFGEVQDPIYYVVDKLGEKHLSTGFHMAFESLVKDVLYSRKELR